MIAKEEDIRDIIKNNPNKVSIANKRTKFKKLNMHVNGIGLDNYIQTLNFFERNEVKQERIKLMRPNVDLISRTLSPRSKIFSAKGGVEEYNLPDNAIPEFRYFLSRSFSGLSLKKWLQNIGIKKYDTDPDGIFLVELGEPINGRANPYLVYKSIMDIYDYELNGRIPEYLVLCCTDKEIKGYQSAGYLPKELTRGQKVYRFIDEAMDHLCITNVKGQPENIAIYHTTPNYFMRMPAQVISDIHGVDEGDFESPLAPVVWLLDAYLLKGSTLEIAELYQAYAKMWIAKTDCFTCEGEGEIDGHKCPDCGGMGLQADLKVSDSLIVDMAADSKTPIPPFGYNVPPVEGLTYLGNRHASIGQLIYYTVWGTIQSLTGTRAVGATTMAKAGKGDTGTAYEASLNEQPKLDKLCDFTEWYQDAYKFIADLCGEIIYRDKYNGSAILGGNRYQVESADAMWERYTAAVGAQAPQAILDSMLIEYIEGKYGANPIQLAKYKLLMRVEPFVHMSVEEVIALNIPEIQKQEKIYYDEWMSSIKDDVIEDVGPNGEEALRKMLRQFVITKRMDEKDPSDDLFIAEDGSILEVGDIVKVKPGRERMPQHAGMKFTVDKAPSENDTTIFLKDTSGNTYNEYGSGDLNKYNYSKVSK